MPFSDAAAAAGSHRVQCVVDHIPHFIVADRHLLEIERSYSLSSDDLPHLALGTCQYRSTAHLSRVSEHLRAELLVPEDVSDVLLLELMDQEVRIVQVALMYPRPVH